MELSNEPEIFTIYYTCPIGSKKNKFSTSNKRKTKGMRKLIFMQNLYISS